MSDVAQLTFEDRLQETFERALPKLGPEARQQLQAIISPESLAIIAGVLVAWVVSHAFGIGAIIDIILVAVGAVAIGLAVFSGIDHLYQFAVGAYGARTNRDLDTAANHLAQAITILGIQAVLAVLFRGAPRTGGSVRLGPPPPRTPGLHYSPSTTGTRRMAPGEGGTDAFGNVTYSLRGTRTDRRLVRVHEGVHQFLTPKLYILRNFRIRNMQGSYARSSLWRYIEEALAETIARVGVQGMREFFTGVRFPVAEGYVFLRRAGDTTGQYGGAGLLPETAGLIAGGAVQGIGFELLYSPRNGTR